MFQRTSKLLIDFPQVVSTQHWSAIGCKGWESKMGSDPRVR